MILMSQLKKGAILSYINILLTNLIGLFLTPFIIRSLGDSEFGLYTLIGAFVGSLTIMDLGLNNTIIRYVAKFRAENDKNSEYNFLGTTMLIYSLIGIVVVAIGIFLYQRLDSLFGTSLTADELEKAKIMYQILVFNLAITLPGGAFTAICNAYEHFVFPRALSIIKYLVRSVLILVILAKGTDAVGLVIIDTVVNIGAILVTLYYTLFKLRTKFRFRSLNMRMISEIFSYSFWIFLYAIVIQLQWNSGQVILGMTADTLTVAVFGVGVMLGSYYGAFASVVNTLLLPRATKLTVYQGNELTYTKEMIKFGRMNSFVLLAILGGFFVIGKDFIRLWIGSSYDLAWQISLAFMIVMTLPLVQSFGNSILEAMKQNRFKSILSITTLSLGVVTAYFLSHDYGLFGVLYPIVFFIFLNSMIMLWYYKRVFGLMVLPFLKEVLLKPVLNLLFLVFIANFASKSQETTSWMGLVIKIGLFCAGYLATNYIFVLNKTEKSALWSR